MQGQAFPDSLAGDLRFSIYGFRNIAAHGHLDLHIDDRVWEIVEVHLPALKAAIEAELRRE